MLRNLTSSEIEFVSGGDGEDPPPEDEINVNGTRLQSLSEQLFSHGGLAGFDTQEFVSQLVADGFFVANSDEERENIFKRVVKALLPPGTNPAVKEALAEAVAYVRGILLAATSLETKAAADKWITENVQLFADYAWHSFMGAPQGTNPIEAFQAIFGAPDVDLDWT